MYLLRVPPSEIEGLSPFENRRLGAYAADDPLDLLGVEPGRTLR